MLSSFQRQYSSIYIQLIFLVLLSTLIPLSANAAGVNWTLSNTSSSENLLDIAWNGTTLYVIVGSNGTILTSPDTTTWTSRTSNTINELRSIIWAGTQFVIAGEGGIVLTSPDGITWTTQTTGVTYRLTDIVWNGTFFVTVGQKSTTVNTDDPSTGVVETSNILIGTLLTSPDAVTWTERVPDLDTSPTVFAPPSRIQKILWDGTRFVAVAAARSIWDETLLQFIPLENGSIITSSDAITWVGQDSGTPNALRALAQNGSLYVAGGSKGTILTSTDSSTWSQSISGTTGTLHDISWNGSVFVAVGENGVILTSLDGLSWTSQTSGTTNWLQSVIWDGSRFVAVGVGDTVLTSAGNDPDLTITGSGLTASGATGDPLKYTLTLTNNGNLDASGIILTSELASSVVFLIATPTQGTCALVSATVTCNLGILAINDTASVTIDVTPSASGTITNFVTVTAAEGGPNNNDNIITVSTMITDALITIGDVNSDSSTTSSGNGAFDLWLLGLLVLWLGVCRMGETQCNPSG